MIKRETLSPSTSASRVRSSILNLKGSAPAHFLKSTSFWGSLRPHVITEQIEPPRNRACGHSRVKRCRDEMYRYWYARLAVQQGSSTHSKGRQEADVHARIVDQIGAKDVRGPPAERHIA